MLKTSELYENKAIKLAREYPMPPGQITEEDARAMMENVAIQMSEWILYCNYIDWDKERNKAAIAILQGFCARQYMAVDSHTVRRAVELADELIKELKEKEAAQ